MLMKVRGFQVDLTKEEVERLAKKDMVGGKKTRYMVVVGEKTVPAKRLFYALLRSKGLPLTLQDITTKDAVYAFRRLGFTVIDKGNANDILSLAGSLSLGGNALEDERRLYSS